MFQAVYHAKIPNSSKLSPNSTKFIEIGVTPMAQHQRLPQPDAPSTGCLFPNAFLSLEKKPLANNTRRGAPRPLPTPNGRVTDALPLNPLPLSSHQAHPPRNSQRFAT
jgi:hypothetical protein